MKDFIALLDALITLADKDVSEMTTWERRKGTSYFHGKAEGLRMARDKAIMFSGDKEEEK